MRAPFIAIALLASAAAPAFGAEPFPFSTVVVNGTRISAERIRTELDATQHASAALHGGSKSNREPGRTAFDATVDRLVVRELLIQEARARGFAVAAGELAAAWEAEQKGWGSPEVFAKSLSVRHLTADFLKERVAEDLAIRKLVRDAVDAKIQPSESDERAYFEKNKARFPKDLPPMLRVVCIDFAKHGGRAGAAARLKEFRARFERGEKFATLAAEFSDHPSAAAGGAIGETPDPVVPFLETGLALRRGQFCDPQSDEAAFYVYFREDAPPAMDFDEARAKVREALVGELKAELFSGLVRDLKGRAHIEYLP